MAFDAAAILRAGLALIAGILTGTVLAVVGVVGPTDAIPHTAQLLRSLVSAHPAGGSGVGAMWRVIIVAEWQVALIYSAIVGAVAALIWYGMGRRGLNRLGHALGLGSVLGAIAGGLVFYKSADGLSVELFEKTALLAVVGAASGLAEWSIGHPRRLNPGRSAAGSSVT